MKTLTIAALSALLVTVSASPAAAQDGERSLGTYSKEISLQYSTLRDIGELSSYGLLVDFGKSIKGGISLVGEFSIVRFGEMEETYSQAAAGIRFGRMAGRKSRAFVQVVGGPQHNFGSTGYAIQPGAGVNVKMKGNVDAKFQVDFPIVRWEGETYKQVRVSVGLGLPFGNR